METKRRIIAVDLDGTLWEEDFPNIGKINNHVVNLVKTWKEEGHVIIIWTCRSDDESVQQAKDKLKELGIKYDGFNSNLPNGYGGDPRKIYCDIYLDDRAVNVLDIDTLDVDSHKFRNHDLDVGFLLDIIRDLQLELNEDYELDDEDKIKVNEIANAYEYEEVYYEK